MLPMFRGLTAGLIWVSQLSSNVLSVGSSVEVPCEMAVEIFGCDGDLVAANLRGNHSDWIRHACPHLCPPAVGRALQGDQQCEPGSTLNTTTGECQICPAGSVSSAATGEGCTHCPKGTHQPSAGASTCYGCPVGKFSDSAGATDCSACPARSSTCGLVSTPLGGVREACHQNAQTVEQCTCTPGYAMDASGACQPCPFGGYCCLCLETAGCVSSGLGACNLSALFYNMEHFDSPCKADQCFSGTDRNTGAMPKPGIWASPRQAIVL